MSSSVKTSAGLLPYRLVDGAVEVFIAHMGGPFWARRDTGAWSIIKGEYEPSEEPLAAARREFTEETGQLPPDGTPIPLGQIRQSGGKLVSAWAVEGDVDPAAIQSNSFTIEWPPRSGRQQQFPEIDRGAWVTLDTARKKLVRGQLPLLETLERLLHS